MRDSFPKLLATSTLTLTSLGAPALGFEVASAFSVDSLELSSAPSSVPADAQAVTKLALKTPQNTNPSCFMMVCLPLMMQSLRSRAHVPFSALQSCDRASPVGRCIDSCIVPS